MKTEVKPQGQLQNPGVVDDDLDLESFIRPQSLADFPGQEALKAKLKVYIDAAKLKNQSLDHVLFCGPPGLGKTTLARIVANELGVEFRATSAPALSRKGDLAAILTSLPAHAVLFIDEIHRLSRDIEEYLYSAMEDYFIDLMTGEGLAARSMRFQLVPFTLIGATTRAGLLKAPFRDRFGIIERLNFYDVLALGQVIARSAQVFKMSLDSDAAHEIAQRSRGTPRIANRLLRRIQDFAVVAGQTRVNLEIVRAALQTLEVDQLGLDAMDRQILVFIADKFKGGPVGIETLAAALSEDSQTLEEVYEPYLLQEGFVHKTPRGRMTTRLAHEHLGLPFGEGAGADINLELDIET